MKIAIVDVEAVRADALQRWFTGAGHESAVFATAASHLADRSFVSASVVFVHFSDRQHTDRRELLAGGRYRARRLVLYAGGEAAWTDYVEAYRDPEHCVYWSIVGAPPPATVREDFLRYLKAVEDGSREGLCEILNAIDWVLEAKLELLGRLLEQPPPHLDVKAALSELDEKLRSVLENNQMAKQVLAQAPSSLAELRNALLPDEIDWVR